MPRSVHDLSHEFKFTCNMGELIPVTTIDCIPGGKYHLDNEALVRMLPMAAPVFDRFNVTFHRFFVPKRLLWDHWDEYVSLTKIGTPAALPVHPFSTIDPALMAADSLSWVTAGNRLLNYMGIPLSYNGDQGSEETFNPMRFAAYQFIYNEYYRDQNLIPEVPYKLVDGINDILNYKTLRLRAWRHDYFTGGLPFVQKGDPVTMPIILSDAEVKYRNDAAPVTTTVLNGAPANVSVQPGVPDNAAVTDLQMFAEMESASSLTTINDFRRANAIQRFQERLARVGSRFTEFLKGVFGVESRDSRLQRPEYIGGDIKPITISEVLNTTGTTELPQGNMSGHGATYISGKGSHYTADEHGYIITIMNIQPNGAYMQGFDREFLKINHPTEIYLPDLANLGEQETFKREIYAYTGEGSEPFNYNPRWTEHRFMPNRVAGLLAADPLMHWTAVRKFDNRPLFNQTFIENKGVGSSDRIFVDTDPDAQNLLVQLYNTVNAVQPIPKLGTPSL